jgi:predicted RNA-binding Zn-ribbon protein involved in translation (DUF1610 family)
VVKRPAKKEYRDPATVTDQEREDFTRRYWDPDEEEQRQSLEAESGLASRDFGQMVGSKATGELCPRCGGGLVWRSRTARSSDQPVCSACRHKVNDWCHCPGCRADQEAKQQRELEAAERIRADAVASWRARFGSEEYVRRAVRELTPSQRAFLLALVEWWDDDRLSMYDIADSAGVQERWVDLHLNRLRVVGLLFHDGEKYLLNSVLAADGVVLAS